MSLYSQFSELRPIPTPEQYDLAHAVTDESFGKQGAWGDVIAQREAFGRDPEMLAKFQSTFHYGYLLGNEDLEEIEYKEWAPTNLVARAFAQGFVQQLNPEQLVYSQRFSLDDAVQMLHRSHIVQNFEEEYEEKRERQHVEAKYILALGQYGLSKIGDESKEYIQKWAADTYPLSDLLRQAFSLGHGAMIICGFYRQRSLNDQLLQIASAQVNLDDEARSILTSGTSEE